MCEGTGNQFVESENVLVVVENALADKKNSVVELESSLAVVETLVNEHIGFPYQK